MGDNVGAGAPGDDAVKTRDPAVRFRCTADDGVLLAGAHRPGRQGGPAWVVAHGFTHGVDKPATRRVMAGFATHGGVVAVDFRGHGRSAGRSSVGRDETLDLDAAVRWARSAGYSPIAAVGFSMGGAVALRHAAMGTDRPDAVIAVSAPSRWYIRETAPMRRLHWLLESPAGPGVGRLLGIRLGEPWDLLPQSPVEAMADIAAPTLLVHGTHDIYFGSAHAVTLQRASRGTAELWIEPGMGHGETATSPSLVGRIAAWCVEQIDPGSPTRVGQPAASGGQPVGTSSTVPQPAR